MRDPCKPLCLLGINENKGSIRKWINRNRLKEHNCKRVGALHSCKIKNVTDLKDNKCRVASERDQTELS